MAKIARFLVIMLTGLSSGTSWHEYGDEQAKGERAIAALVCLCLALLALTGACAYDIFIGPMDRTLLLAFILLSAPFAIVLFIGWDRRITDRNRERAEAAQAQKSPGSPG